MGEELERFRQWKSAQIANSSDRKLNGVDSVIEFLKFLQSNNELKNPLESETESFLNEFIPSIQAYILSTNCSRNLNASKPYGKVLLNIIKVFVRFIASPYDIFLRKAAEILFNQNSMFYLTTSSNSSSKSAFLKDIEKAVYTSDILQRINTYYNQQDVIYTMEKIKIVSDVLDLLKVEFFNNKKSDFAETVISVMRTVRITIDEKKIRTIDENDYIHVFNNFNKIFNIFPLSDRDVKIKVLRAVQLETYFLFVNSEYLNKKYAGLEAIRKVVCDINPSEQCRFLRDRKLIDILLKELRPELVPDFFLIFGRMCFYDFITEEQIKQLWNITVKQFQSEMDVFLKSWKSVIGSFNAYRKEILFNAIIEERAFPEQVLLFLENDPLHLDNDKRITLFNVLHDLYFSSNCDVKIKNQLLKTITHNIPNEGEFAEKLQEECMELIKNKERFEYTLSILQTSLLNISSEKAKIYFDSVIEIIVSNPVNAVDYLELLSRILKKFQQLLSKEELEKLLQITRPMFETDMCRVCKFYQTLLSTWGLHLFDNDAKITIFKEITNYYNEGNNYIDLVCNLFNSINAAITEVDEFIGIDSFWGLVLRTGDQKLVEFLIKKYSSTKNPKYVQIIIDECMKHIDTIGALKIILTLISQIECKINKETLGIENNMFIPDEDYITIAINGLKDDVLRVPKNISLEQLISKIAVLIDKKKTHIKLQYGNQVLTSSNLIRDCRTFTVIKENFPAQELPIIVEELPTVILMKQEYSDKLYEILLKDDELSNYALRILNQMPTLQIELDILRNTDIKWEEFFSISKKNLFLYRSHTIGNFLSKQESDWITYFFNTQGAIKYMNIILNSGSNAFDDNNMILILRIIKLMCQMNQWEYPEGSINTEELISSVLHLDNCVLIDLYTSILEKCLTSKQVMSCPSLYPLLQNLFFTDNEHIRQKAKDISLRLLPEDGATILLPLLDTAATKVYVSDFFNVIGAIAMNLEDPLPIWNESLKCLFKFYQPPTSDDPIDQLKFKPPVADFTKALISLINFVCGRLQTPPQLQELFEFLLYKILFNKYKYYEPTSDLVNLLILSSQSREENKSQIIHCFSEIDLSNPQPLKYNLTNDQKYRGIMNLGATCYVNSMVQQLFHTPEFREVVLRSNINNDSWVFQYQYIFTQLMYFPSTYIDIKYYISQWKGWDDVPINPGEQQDTVEYLQMFIDRIESEIPHSFDIFRGKFINVLKGIDKPDYVKIQEDEFLTFPLEVKDHKNVSDSLETFLIPQKFEGKDKYKADDLDMKIDAERVTFIKEAPKILICQLKRFEYNLSTSSREKINTEYTYPFELDLTECMYEREKVIYDLTGVIVHMGSAMGGHYFSYIKTEEEQWYTFNDINITPLNPSELISKTIGGKTKYTYYDDSLKHNVTTEMDDNVSAYLLFYRKREEAEAASFEQVKDLDVSMEEFHNEISENTLTRLLDDIKQTFLKNIGSCSSFFKLVLDMCSSDEGVPFFYDYFTNMLRSAHPAECNSLMEKCIEKIHKMPKLCETFLLSENQLFSLILCEPSEGIRESYLTLLRNAISSCNNQEVLGQFVDILLNKILEDPETLVSYWYNYDQIFQLFLALNNHYEIDPMSFTTIIIQFLTEPLMNYEKTNPKENIFLTLNISALFELLTIFFDKFKKDLQEELSKTIISLQFIGKYILSPNHIYAFSRLISVLLMNDKENSSRFIEIMNEKAHEMDATMSSNFFFIALFINDQLCESRYQWFISFLKGKQSSFIGNFFAKINTLIKISKSELCPSIIPYSSKFIYLFLFNEDPKVRVQYVDFMKLIIDIVKKHEPSQIFEYYKLIFNSATFQRVYTSTISFNNGIDQGTISKSQALNQLLLREYLEITKYLVLAGNFKNSFTSASISYVDLMYECGKYSTAREITRNLIFNFITDLLPVNQKDSFFSIVSFEVFIDCFQEDTISNSPKIIQQLMDYIPKDGYKTFFKSNLFSNIMHKGIKSPQIAKHLSIILPQHLTEDISKSVCRDHVFLTFSNNVEYSYEYYLEVCWGIMEKLPVASDHFFYNNCHIYLLSKIRKDVDPVYNHTPHPKFGRTMAAFINGYIIQNANKSPFYSKVTYAERLAKYIMEEKIDFDSLMTAALKTIDNTEGHDGYWRYIEALARLSKEINLRIYVKLNSLDKPLMEIVNKFNQQAALKMIVTVYTNDAKNNNEIIPEIIPKLLREASFIQYCDEYYQAIYELVDNYDEYKEKIFALLNGAFYNADTHEPFAGYACKIAKKYAKKYPEERETFSNWLIDSMRVLSNEIRPIAESRDVEIMKEFVPDFKVLYMFINYFVSKFKLEFPKFVDVSIEKLQDLASAFEQYGYQPQDDFDPLVSLSILITT